MSRRVASPLSTTAALLLAAACGSGPEGDPRGSDSHDSGRPDIVLVSIDSLRYDHLGCYGYGKPTSPTIDRLAQEGARFANAVSTTSWTLPAHAALFTGLYDSAHGLVANGLQLGPDHVTLAELLRDAGYHTAGFFGGPYLHPTFGLNQGFEVYRSCMAESLDELSPAELRNEATNRFGAWQEERTGQRLIREVDRWLETADDRDFFLFLHMWDVHFDYTPPERYVEMFDPDYEGDLTSVGFMNNPQIEPGMPARDLAHLLALYDGEVRYADDVLSEILDRIREQRPGAEPLVIVTSDHGDEFFEHGAKGHRLTLFEEVVRVPLIFHWPGHIDAGRVVEDQVRLIDVLPTLLSLARVDLPFEVQGRDVTPLLRGESLEPKEAVVELRRGRRSLLGVRSNDSKLIAGEGFTLFYDLATDPDEQRPLTPDSPGFAEALAALRGVEADMRRFARRPGNRAIGQDQFQPEIVRQLQELGYLDDPDGESLENEATAPEEPPL